MGLKGCLALIATLGIGRALYLQAPPMHLPEENLGCLALFGYPNGRGVFDLPRFRVK